MAEFTLNHEARQPLTVSEETSAGFTEEELELARLAPNKAVTTRPRTLGYISIVLIIVNRMVGTGIFRTPSTLAHGTQSTGFSLVFWAVGGVVAISGAHVFAEFGLTVPRLDVEGDGKQSVARNGGEKNYLEYMVKRPRYLATCVYGIAFVILGNMAGNALVFATSILSVAQSSTYHPPEWQVRFIAILAATFASLLHAVWRSGGIIINNIFGGIKLAMLLTMFVLGIAYSARAFGGNPRVASENLSIHKSFQNASASPYGYAQAFLSVIFAYGGFNQASYVLGEIDHPRKKFKSTTIWTVTMVSLLYILVNLAYMMVVPREIQIQVLNNVDTVGSEFFIRIFGSNNSTKVKNSFLAFSSLGNIIVQTFTATRVKQEIAKEGILPYAKFFASNSSILPRRLRPKSWTVRDETPVGAFFLHWTFAVIWILITIPVGEGAYRLFVSFYSFTIDAVFGFLVGLSIIYLRLFKQSSWSKKSTSNYWISLLSACIFTLANLFPLVAIWIPPPSNNVSTRPIIINTNNGKVIPWYTTSTVGMSIILLGFLYWVALAFVLPWFRGLWLEVDREPSYVKSPDGKYWIMWHEIVSFSWRPK